MWGGKARGAGECSGIVFSSEVKFSSMSVHVCFTTRIAQFQISTRAAIVTSRFNTAVWSAPGRETPAPGREDPAPGRETPALGRETCLGLCPSLISGENTVLCNICDHRENERITVYTHCAYHTHATINGREPPFLTNTQNTQNKHRTH